MRVLLPVGLREILALRKPRAKLLLQVRVNRDILDTMRLAVAERLPQSGTLDEMTSAWHKEGDHE